MKRVLVIVIAGMCMFPWQEAQAYSPVNSAFDDANATARIVASSMVRKGSTQGSRQGSMQGARQSAKQAFKVKSRKQATQMVKQKYQAKVLSVQLTEVERESVYVAKLLGNDGVVFYVHVNARSGQMRRR